MLEWRYEVSENLKYITVEKWFRSGVRTAFSTRSGGCSQGPYESLNMGLHVGDQTESVIKNRTRFLHAVEADLQDMVCCEQIHGCEIARVGKADVGRGAMHLSTAVPKCDAMITDVPGLSMVAFFADCFPLYFYDPRCRAVGLAHAGWKGTMMRIAARTIEEMTRQFGSDVHDIEVFIGPGIGPCCFEIKEELARNVSSEFPLVNDLIVCEAGRLAWDLIKTNLEIIRNAGVSEKNIGVCRLCTACNSDLFFSHRRDKGLTGRMGAAIALSK